MNEICHILCKQLRIKNTLFLNRSCYEIKYPMADEYINLKIIFINTFSIYTVVFTVV